MLAAHKMHEAEGSAASSPELGNIFSLYGDKHRSAHSLSPEQSRAMHAIEICRTEELGGYLLHCDDELCGFEQTIYHSCRNRHCPKCQALAKAKWLEARMAELLPVPYYHVVFTLHHALHPIVRCNKKLVFDFFFDAVNKTMQEFGKNELKGELGFLAVLHTWDQLLWEHHHLHLLVPGGAVAFDQSAWNPASNKYLFPVDCLATVFRAKFLTALKKAYKKGEFEFHGQAKAFESPAAFQRLIDKLYKKGWIVYSKPPFSGPEKVLDYLARYVHRVAISNNRILDVSEGIVTFSYRDRKDEDKLKTKKLEADEFIRRFLLHVLPDNFMKIRSYGFLSNSVKKKKLAICRKLLNAPTPKKAKKKTVVERLIELTGKDPTLCPKCEKGKLERVKEIKRPKRRMERISETTQTTPDTS